jgi:alkylhydroperoxidase family enzyme
MEGSWLPGARRATSIDDVLDLRPDLAEPLDDLLATLRAGPIERELLDSCEALVRRRIGVPVTGPVPDTSARDLDARTRNVLYLTEQFVLDPHGIDIDLRDAVLDHCSLEELATLVQAIAVFDALARMEAVLTSPDDEQDDDVDDDEDDEGET